MGTRHWEDDELIGRLYGLGPGDGHLEECEPCARRWNAMVAARERVLAPPDVPENLLARQRTAIEARAQVPAGNPGWLTLTLGTGLAAVILMAVTLYRPAPAPLPSDSEFFAEVYSMAGSTEPLAVEPIHALFEVEQ